MPDKVQSDRTVLNEAVMGCDNDRSRLKHLYAVPAPAGYSLRA